MELRRISAWIVGAALIASGATLLRAQPAAQPAEAPVPSNRGALRARIIKLRTETEMLRLDYELARESLLEELKIVRGLKLAGGLFQLGAAVQDAVNESGEKAPGVAPTPETRKQSAEAAKAAELEEKKAAAEQAAYVAESKKELARLFTSLSEKRLDLEDAERAYRATSP